MGEIVAGSRAPYAMFPALVKRDGPQCQTAQLYRAVAVISTPSSPTRWWCSTLTI